MSTRIRVIADADEFIKTLRIPGDKCVLFMPKEYTTIDNIDILENYNEKIVYADVIVNNGIAIHPSFAEEVIQSQLQFISPIFYQGNKALFVESEKIQNMTDLTKQLFTQIPGHHIPIPLYAII